MELWIIELILFILSAFWLILWFHIVKSCRMTTKDAIMMYSFLVLIFLAMIICFVIGMGAFFPN